MRKPVMSTKSTKETWTAVKRTAHDRTSRTKRKRLPPEKRTQEFVEKAIEYFADVGFEGGTRGLARRLGVTQPLLYRYFPTKEHLIRQVYEQVYLSRWEPEWEELLRDRSLDLQDRLSKFYHSYTDAIFSREWMRIYMFSGLRGVEINKWYRELVEERLLKRICHEYRREIGLPGKKNAIRDKELELVWTLHGGIVYYGVRKFIYDLPVYEDKSSVIENALEVFFKGAESTFRKRN